MWIELAAIPRAQSHARVVSVASCGDDKMMITFLLIEDRVRQPRLRRLLRMRTTRHGIEELWMGGPIRGCRALTLPPRRVESRRLRIIAQC